QIGAFVGDGVRALLERALGGADAKEVVDRAMAAFLQHYGAHLLDSTALYPGIRELLDALRHRGVTLSVLSNKPEDLVRRIVDGLGIASCFLAVLGGDSLPTRKPDPAGVHHLLAAAGVTPSPGLLVGASRIALAPAAGGGVGFCGVAWGFPPERLRAAAPPVLVANAAGVLDVIEPGYAPAAGR